MKVGSEGEGPLPVLNEYTERSLNTITRRNHSATGQPSFHASGSIRKSDRPLRSLS